MNKKIPVYIVAFILISTNYASGMLDQPGEYTLNQNTGNFVFASATMNVAVLAVNEAASVSWWDVSRRFRLPVTVQAAGFERFEKPVDVNINFTQILTGLGQTGTFDENSIRVIEIDSSGTILNATVPFQFDRDPNFNTATRASGNIIFIMSGITPANGNRYYHIYFNMTGGSYTPLSVTPLVTLIDNVIDEGKSSYKVKIIDSTFFFQKQAGGFSSWNDKSGNDWIGWNTANGSSGKFRGVPNAVNPEEVFHPGFNCCVSTVISQGPIKIRIRSVNGTKWESIWDFYPRYAIMTMTKAGHNYWFLYEGVPGGLLEKTKDFMVRSNGIKTFLNQSWSGDIASNEWAYFSDPNTGGTGRSLFVTHNEDDLLRDQYWSHTNMTVFGFGRNESGLQKLLSTVPQHFTIGMMDGTDYIQNSKLIYSAYKNLNIIKGAAEQYGTGNGIIVTAPNGGENWARGTTKMISWSSSGSPGANVRIELLKGGVLNRTINSSTPNDGSYSWTIPSTQTIGSNYKVRITSTTNSAYTDTSNNNFTIGSSTPTITVVSPNGGENWVRGTTRTISWSSSGSPGAYVKIELLKAGVLNRVITSSTANDGSYGWFIPSTQTLGTDYKIRITSTTNAAYTDTSNNNFIIGTGTGITVVSPNGGENWARGTTRMISWSSSGSPGAYVKIELLKAGVLSRVITSSTANDGSYSWAIPSTQTLGSDYKIRVTSTTNSAYKDTSNNNFIISI